MVTAANTTTNTAASTDQVRLKIGDQKPHEGDGYEIRVGGNVKADLTIDSTNINSYYSKCRFECFFPNGYYSHSGFWNFNWGGCL